MGGLAWGWLTWDPLTLIADSWGYLFDASANIIGATVWFSTH